MTSDAQTPWHMPNLWHLTHHMPNLWHLTHRRHGTCQTCDINLWHCHSACRTFGSDWQTQVLACGASDVTGLCHRFGMCHGICASDVTGLACGASDVTGLCHRFGMCHGICASDVTGLACGASDVTGLACAMASVRQMSQVWHVVRQMSQVYVTGLACGASDVTGLCHRFGMWCVRCHRFMLQVWHVSWHLCVRCQVT